MPHCSQTFSVDFAIFIAKTTLEEIKEICKHIHKEIQYNNEKEIIDSKID